MNTRVVPIRLRHMYVSDAHNYFGHHGREPGTNPMREVDRVDCVAGRGLRGDRFFDYKKDYKGQVTFFAWETYQGLCRTFNLADVPPSACRRNVIVEGIDLNELIGCRFAIQGVEFEADSECKPCYWMDRAFAPGAEEYLKGFGGLRARILSDGSLVPGDCELTWQVRRASP